MAYTAEELFDLLNEQGKYHLSTEPMTLSTEPMPLSTEPKSSFSTQPLSVSTQPFPVSTQPLPVSTQPPAVGTQPLFTEIPQEILDEIASLRKKEHNFGKVSDLILKVCSIKSMTSDDIALIFSKREDYLRRRYLNKLITEKKLRFLYPEMINHPKQAYLTNKKD